MKVIIEIIKYFFVILLACAITGIILLKIIDKTILNEEYVIKKFEETNYYSKLEKEVKEKFSEYVMQSGLDEVVITEVITSKKIKEDTNIILKNIYEGTSNAVDIIPIEEQLTNNINQYIGGRKITTQSKNSINEFVSLLGNEYINLIMHTKYEATFNQYLEKARIYSQFVKKVCIIASGISILLLILLNKKILVRLMSFVGILSAFFGGIIGYILYIINENIYINDFEIINEAISDIVKVMYNDVLINIKQYAIASVIIGFIFIVLGNSFREIVYRNYRLKAFNRKKESRLFKELY